MGYRDYHIEVARIKRGRADVTSLGILLTVKVVHNSDRISADTSLNEGHVHRAGRSNICEDSLPRFLYLDTFS